MLIFFLASAFVLLAAPLYTQNAFREAYHWQESQIRVDNAGIRLGRKIREVLNTLDKANLQVRQLEKVHDSLHLCAKIPGYQQAACQVADKAHEAILKGLSHSARAMAEISWQAGYAKARVSLIEAGKSQGSNLLGPQFVPVELERCSICHLAFLWKVFLDPKFDLSAGPIQNPNRVSVEVKRSVTDSWDFWLRVH